MGTKYQRNRIYSLIIGNEDDAVEINNLQIKFEVVKTSGNREKKNTAYVEIYNLSEERRKALETEYIAVSLSVGYTDTGLSQLFVGEAIGVTNTKLRGFRTKRSGTDLITRIDIDEMFTELNIKAVNKIVPAGKTVGDAIKECAKEIEGVTRQLITGDNVKTTLPDGYPLSGTPRSNLDKISYTYNIDWQIDGGTLYVCDANGSHTKEKGGVPLIGQFSGLIDRPEYINEAAKRDARSVKNEAPKNVKPKPNAIKLKILLNPTIVAGSTIKLDFEDLTGYYKVGEVKHKGNFRSNEWYSELVCTERLD